ncbi:fibronectin type III domain-containing protein [Actinoplanes sp. CA-030573]|uniref:fibronectin type III domain-containing protein n=1 Tax=Actinoplanes sp. CA-030573 TaxID=3239898 RepID=UPI003D903D89
MAAAGALLAVGGVLANPAPAMASPLASPDSASAVPGRRTILVSWTPPGTPGGVIARYRATANPGGAYCDASAVQTSCTITGLTANTPYTVDVIVCPNLTPTDATDCSAPATTASVTPGPPAAPSKPVVTYSGDPTAMHVSWSANGVGAGIASYKVTPSPSAPGQTGTCTGLVSYPANSCDIAGLEPGTAYTFRVAANGVTNAAGSSGTSTLSPASDAKIAGPPIAPDAPTVVRASDTSVDLSWTRPSGGPAITGYTVSKTVDGATTGVGACTKSDPDDTSCTVTGLDMAKSYTFTVTSVGETNGGSSVASAASAAITPGFPGRPDAPSVELGDVAGKVTVYWDEPADGGTVDSYVVTPSPATGNLSPATCTVNSPTTQCAFEGLENGTAYTFTVTAHNNAGDQTSAASAPIVSQLPDKPGTPAVTLGDAPGKVSLSWTPATGGGTVTNYVVTADPADGGSAGTQDAGCGANLAAPSCVITGLTPGDTYTFTVSAVGDLGAVASDPSDEIVPDQPGTPADVDVTLAGDPVVATVSWTVPTTGGGLVTGYRVLVASTDGGALPATNPCEVGPTVSHCDFSGLDGTKHYTFTVSAVNTAGETAASPTAPIVPSKPGAPTDPTVTIDGPGTVTVGWTAPTGAAVTGYTVTATSADQTADVSAGCIGGPSDTDCQITDLSRDKPYSFVVTANNSLGGTSAAATAPIVADLAQEPTSVVALPGAASGTVEVTWTAPTGGGTVSGYTVTTASTDGGTLPTPNPCEAGPATTSCTITGLDLDKHYNFTVAAVNDLGSAPAPATTPDLVPDAPGVPTSVDVALKANTPGTVVVSWDAPTDRGAPTGYEVLTSSTDGGVLPTTNPCVVAATETSCEITGLNATKSYQFVVSAKNPRGHSDAAATTALKPDKPGAPTAPQVALGDADGSVTVSWTPPAGGGAITGYRVTAASSDGGTETPTCTGDPGDTSCDVTGLDPDKTYTFTVEAANAAGTAGSVATDAIVPGPSPAPTNVQVQVSPTPGTVTVTWDEPAGAVVDAYTVTPTTGGMAGPTCTPNPATDRTCTLTGLDPTRSYTFTVRAENALDGNTSAPTVAVIPNKPNAPGMPKADVIAADESGVTARVMWPPSPPGAGPVAGYTVTAFATDAPSTPVTSAACTDVAADASQCDFGGLDATKEYTFVVTANGSAGGTSESQPSWPVSMAGPDAPGATTLALNGANAVRVSWDEPTTGGPVTGYSVTSSPAVATPTACLHVEKSSCIFTGLISGTAYSFTVTTEGTAGRTAVGEPSDTIVVGPPDVPARPAVAPGATTSEVVVSWDMPSPGAGIDGYVVESVPGRIGCAEPAGADATSCVVSGLDPATRYTFRVQAVGAGGSGSSAFSRASEPIVPQAPGRPYNVDVLAGNRQVAVSWTAPANAADRVVSYRAVASPGGAACTTTGTECVIGGLTNLTSYTITVTAVGPGEGNVATSVPSARVRPNAGAPGSPTAVTAVGGNASAVVSWTAPANTGDGIARYTASTTDANGTHTCTTPNGATTTCTITGLTNGQVYQITVVSVGQAATGWSAPSAAASVTPRTPPGTPRNVVATGGVRSIAVQWASGGAGDGLAGFTASATPAAGGAPLTCAGTTATATTCTLSNVTPGVYAVTVVANGSQTGVKSAASEAVTATALFSAAPTLSTTTMPTAPNALTATSSSGRAGSTVTVSGSGFAPYTGVALALYAGGARLGTAVTDASGTFTATVTIPAGTAAGAKTIIAAGLPPAGTLLRYAKAAFTVVAVVAT